MAISTEKQEKGKYNGALITCSHGIRQCPWHVPCLEGIFQFTRTIGLTPVQCWSNALNVGPAVYRCKSSPRPANTRRAPNVVLMLGHRRRRWTNIKASCGCWEGFLDLHPLFPFFAFRQTKYNRHITMITVSLSKK